MTYKFQQVLKPKVTSTFREHPARDKDAIRLSTSNFIIGKGLSSRFKGRKKAAYVLIEKDVRNTALKVVAVPKGTPDSYSVCPGSSRADLHTTRLSGLSDLPNGVYKEKEENIFVLQRA